MGHSDDSDSEYYVRKSTKKRKKRRERSRSSSEASDTSRLSSSRHKKSKKKRDRRRSPSPERRRRKRSRSRRRSRSADSHKRSPSPSRSRRRSSRSRSRDQRSRSRDRLSPSRGRRGRSWSHSRTGSQRSSEERRLESKHSSSASLSSTALKGLTLSDLTDMTPSQQAEERLRQALKAAAAADEKIRQHSQLDSSSPLRVNEASFAERVREIESDRFVPASFSSSYKNARREESSDLSSSHDAAIFGSLSTEGFVIQPDTEPANMDWQPESLMHPSLFCDVEEKMDRWMERLSQLRKRKLEGEAMCS